MNNTLFNDENNDSALHLAGHDPSYLRHRPVVLFIKVGLVIIFCEATIMATLHLLNVTSILGIALDPLLLAVLGTICLYWFIVSPMSGMLAINEKVKSKLELFRGLLDKSNDAIFIIDPPSAKLLDVNYRACTTLGYTRDELLNMTILEIEESVTDSSGWAEHVGRVSNDGHEFLQGRQKRKDGTTFPVEVNFNLINWASRDYMVAVARDASEHEYAQNRLKESETKFRKLAQCAKNAMLVMGPKGEISFWNPAAERIFGYSQSEVIGKNLHTLLVPERFRDAFLKGFAGFQKTGQGNIIGKTIKMVAMRSNGSEFNVEISISSVQLNGEWHAIGIIRDLSEKAKTEADLANQGKATEAITN